MYDVRTAEGQLQKRTCDCQETHSTPCVGSSDQETAELRRHSNCVEQEGNGYPLQCSCLENPRDGGAWRAAVYGVPQSRTRLKRLSSSSSSLYSDLDFPNKPSWSSFLSLDWRYCGDCLLSGDGGSVFFLSLPQPSTPSSPPQTLTSAP